nr:DNA repair protein RecO C-terminal domain-containing protein [uncultured Psychrobacter sp.]
MRNEALTGYLLHQRSYQEKRALYYLFSEQYGVVHGIGKKGAPLFVPLQLFATGKRDLKTFSQINIAQIPSNSNSHSDSAPKVDQVSSPMSEQELVVKDTKDPINELSYKQITGQHQYAALYLNEILWRLLPTEDPMPVLWHHYQNSLEQLKQPLTADELRLCLRHFEQHLFTELGFSLTLEQDNMLNAIEPDMTYRFLPDAGLVPIVHTEATTNATAQSVFEGEEIIKMVEQGVVLDTLSNWSRLYRQLIDHLLDYQPLQSRLLWQQQQRYQ